MGIEIDEMAAKLAVWLCVCLAVTSILTEVVVADDDGGTSLDNTEIPQPTERKHFPNQVDDDGIPNHYQPVDHAKMGYQIHRYVCLQDMRTPWRLLCSAKPQVLCHQ